MMRCFLRTQIVAIVATSADFAVSWLLFGVLPCGDICTAFAVAMGAVTGALISCTVNHRWTFRGNGNRPLAVARRYAMVWAGSLLLNTAGTVLLCHHVSPPILAKGIVAIIVAVAWNYPLFSLFVYRVRR